MELRKKLAYKFVKNFEGLLQTLVYLDMPIEGTAFIAYHPDLLTVVGKTLRRILQYIQPKAYSYDDLPTGKICEDYYYGR